MSVFCSNGFGAEISLKRKKHLKLKGFTTAATTDRGVPWPLWRVFVVNMSVFFEWIRRGDFTETQNTLKTTKDSLLLPKQGRVYRTTGRAFFSSSQHLVKATWTQNAKRRFHLTTKVSVLYTEFSRPIFLKIQVAQQSTIHMFTRSLPRRFICFSDHRLDDSYVSAIAHSTIHMFP